MTTNVAATGGKFVYLYDIESIYDIFDIDFTSDEDSDGIPDYYEEKIIDGVLRLGDGTTIDGLKMGNPDTDGDGLKDGEELEIRVIDSSAINDNEQIVYVKMHSNPTMMDTDGDLENDNTDPFPTVYRLNDEFIYNISKLETLANEYDDFLGLDILNKFSIDRKYWLSFMFIRQFNSSYTNGNNWTTVGGPIDYEFVDFVKYSDSELYDYFENKTHINADLNGGKVDVFHMAATTTIYIYNSNMLDALYLNYYGFDDMELYEWDLGSWLEGNLKIFLGTMMFEHNLDNLGGWAGDLQTLMNDVHRNSVGDENPLNYSYDEFYNEIYKTIGSRSFSMEDLYADTDSYNIYMKLLNDNKITLEEAFEDYYKLGYKNRYTSFTNSWNRDKVNSLVQTYTAQNFFNFIDWPLFYEYKYTDEQSKATADAFTDFIFEKIAKELD